MDGVDCRLAAATLLVQERCAEEQLQVLVGGGGRGGLCVCVCECVCVWGWDTQNVGDLYAHDDQRGLQTTISALLL